MLTTEQQAIRATGIGGSEIAAVAGLSPYATPLDIYLRKVEPQPDVPNFHKERGTYLERGLIDWYADRKGFVVKPAPTMRHPRHKHVLATPDAIVFDGSGRRTLEVKFPHWRSADEWGPDGTDEVHEMYVPQMMFEAACAETPLADAAAFINGDLRSYSVPFDEELSETLCELAERFWRDHVEKRVPPPIDGSKSYSDYLAKKFPRSTGYMRLAGAREEELAESLRDIRAEIDALETRKSEVENLLKDFIGDADGVEGPWGKITWKKPKDGTHVNWEALATELAPSPDLIAKHTTITPGSRRFIVPRSWSKTEE